MADGMFQKNCVISRRPLTTEEAADLIKEGVVSTCNVSHTATIEALEERHDIVVEIPERPPIVFLEPGDRLIIFSPRGLPRLVDRHEYTKAEIDAATFVFGLWTVVGRYIEEYATDKVAVTLKNESNDKYADRNRSG